MDMKLIVSLLIIGMSLNHKMVDGTLVCKGENKVLRCPSTKSEWQVEQLESGLRFRLVKWRSGKPSVMETIPVPFKRRVNALGDGSLELLDFQREMNGKYYCYGWNFMLLRVYHLKAGYCSLNPCLGKNISVEVSIYNSKDPVDTIELFVNETKIQELNTTLNTVFQAAPKLPFYITNGERLILEGPMVNGDFQFLKVRITYKGYGMMPQVQNIKVIPKVCASHAAQASSSTPSKEPTTKKELEEDEKRSANPPTLKRPSSNGELEQHEKKRANPPLPKQSGTQISIKVHFLFVCLVACFVLMEYIPCV